MAHVLPGSQVQSGGSSRRPSDKASMRSRQGGWNSPGVTERSGAQIETEPTGMDEVARISMDAKLTVKSNVLGVVRA